MPGIDARQEAVGCVPCVQRPEDHVGRHAALGGLVLHPDLGPSEDELLHVGHQRVGRIGGDIDEVLVLVDLPEEGIGEDAPLVVQKTRGSQVVAEIDTGYLHRGDVIGLVVAAGGSPRSPDALDFFFFPGRRGRRQQVARHQALEIGGGTLAPDGQDAAGIGRKTLVAAFPEPPEVSRERCYDSAGRHFVVSSCGLVSGQARHRQWVGDLF
mmetsp:Transcript_1864/g.3996  ORF Transcript_1864/g.3996 Transcript_1864/m.3996 type:complete len:211 (-) Transcript_1864:38-670(-)